MEWRNLPMDNIRTTASTRDWMEVAEGSKIANMDSHIWSAHEMKFPYLVVWLNSHEKTKLDWASHGQAIGKILFKPQ